MSTGARTDGDVVEAELPESRASLWRLIVAPTLWALHFLFSYATVAIVCAKRGEWALRGTASMLVGLYTALALIGIVAAGWRGLRHHRYGAAALPHDGDTPADRHRFLGFATLLLAGLSLVATLYVAAAMVFVASCR